MTDRLFVVNELSFARLAWLGLTGRKPLIVAIRPTFPQLLPLASRAVAFLASRGRATIAKEKFPDLEILYKIPPLAYRDDGFARTEAATRKVFGFNSVDEDCWGRAYKFSVCSYLDDLFFPLKVVAEWARHHGRPVQVFGLSAHTADIFKELYGDCSVSFRSTGKLTEAIMNVLMTVLVWARCVTFIIARTRFFMPTVKSPNLVADFLNDPADFPIYKAAAPGGVVLIQRSPAHNPLDWSETREFERVTWSDGKFPIWQGFSLIFWVTLSHIGLTLRHLTKPPALYRQLTLLRQSWVRTLAISNIYQPDIFWGRDPYNADHCLRREIFSKHGTVSAGINHAIPNSAIIQPRWRYISYDRFYVFGQYLYERYYKETWAPDMKVVAVGAHGITRKEWESSKTKHTHSIAFFMAHAVGHPGAVAMIRAVAEKFPERTIYVQLRDKHVYRADEFIEQCTENLENVEIYKGRPYGLFSKVSYVFSDPSTVLVEAIQARIITFFMDVIKEQRESLYRDFPQLPVGTAQDAVDRINAIETGNETYDFNRFDGLTEMSGRYFLDILLADINLLPNAKLPALLNANSPDQRS